MVLGLSLGLVLLRVHGEAHRLLDHNFKTVDNCLFVNLCVLVYIFKNILRTPGDDTVGAKTGHSD